MANHELNLQALSCRSPQSPEAMSAILTQLEPTRRNALTVLPEYLISGGFPFDFKGVPMSHPYIGMIEQFAQDTGSSVVAGTVLEDEGRKTLTSLLITPDGVAGRHDKRNPTHFELNSGISKGEDPYQVFTLPDGTRLTIVTCFDIYEEDPQIRAWLRGLKADAPHVVAHPRGFDLDDPQFGMLAENWSRHLQDFAALTRTNVGAATGIIDGHRGAVTEIISFEGESLAYSYNGGEPISAKVNTDLLEKYRRGEYQSKIVPLYFT